MPIVGGNCDNGSKCGRYLNVNNVAGNARWNIGASLFLPLSLQRNIAECDLKYSVNVNLFPQPMLKINLPRGAASKRTTAHRRGGDKKGKSLLKSYNGLFDAMLDSEDAAAAIIEAARYKTDRPSVRNILEHKEEVAERICQKIERGEWFPPHHEKQKLQEGSHRKEREIVKPRFDDEQIVHHMLIRRLRPIITSRLYRYVYGSLPGRGSHEAVKVMTRWRNDYGNKRFYVFEGDVKKFYDNIEVDILKDKIDCLIRDRKYKDVLFHVIDESAPGLPKGICTERNVIRDMIRQVW